MVRLSAASRVRALQPARTTALRAALRGARGFCLHALSWPRVPQWAKPLADLAEGMAVNRRGGPRPHRSPPAGCRAATCGGKAGGAREGGPGLTGGHVYVCIREAGQTTVKTNMDHVYSCQYRTHSPVCVSHNYGHTRVNAGDGRDDSAHVLSKPLWS